MLVSKTLRKKLSFQIVQFLEIYKFMGNANLPSNVVHSNDSRSGLYAYIYM